MDAKKKMEKNGEKKNIASKTGANIFNRIFIGYKL